MPQVTVREEEEEEEKGRGRDEACVEEQCHSSSDTPHSTHLGWVSLTLLHPLTDRLYYVTCDDLAFSTLVCSASWYITCTVYRLFDGRQWQIHTSYKTSVNHLHRLNLKQSGSTPERSPSPSGLLSLPWEMVARIASHLPAQCVIDVLPQVSWVALVVVMSCNVIAHFSLDFYKTRKIYHFFFGWNSWWSEMICRCNIVTIWTTQLCSSSTVSWEISFNNFFIYHTLNQVEIDIWSRNSQESEKASTKKKVRCVYWNNRFFLFTCTGVGRVKVRITFGH